MHLKALIIAGILFCISLLSIGVYLYKSLPQTHPLPPKVIGGYLCNSSNVTSTGIIQAGYNYIVLSFYAIQVDDGQFNIVSQSNITCCQPTTAYDIVRDLLAKGVTVSVSIGGDGCQGSAGAAGDILSLSDEAIVAGFEAFREVTNVNFDGIDFDWEQDNGDISPESINKIGRALRTAGYITTAVPMSSQFMPGGIQGWKKLDPDAIDAVLIQWYQGGCTGTQTCPCWGNHPLIMDGCPGWGQSYLGQSAKCGTIDWINGFFDPGVGDFKWPLHQVIIGGKSWCGGDVAAACQQQDTGIWGVVEMQNILTRAGNRGVFLWDVNDYFNPDFFTVGRNSINKKCLWTNHMKVALGMSDEILPENDVDCDQYSGEVSQVCQSSYFFDQN